MPLISESHYTGNQGDSCVFNLNRKGLPGIDNKYYRNGNVGVDGTVYNNGFEVWIARWNFGDKISWASATFDIGGKYKTLTGKSSVIKGSTNTTSYDTSVYFYNGETLLYSFRMTPDDYEKSFKVDVTGVSNLTVMVKDNKEAAGGTSFALYDLFFDSSSDGGELPDIPSTAVKFNGHYYQVYDNSMTWTEAKEYCEKLGGHLVTITSIEENNYIKDLVVSNGKKNAYWLGASDSETEGVWKWVTGEPFEFSDWGTGEPSQDGEENYLELLVNALNYSLKWNDSNLNGGGGMVSLQNHGFICEWDGSSKPGGSEPGSNAPFNQPTYIADIWSGNRKEKTPEHEQLSWYYNGYKPITRTIVEEMGDTAFKFWDGVKCVSNPANGAEIALKKEKQRELIIFDAIRDVLGSPEFSDIISTSAASDLVGWTKSLNSAAKKIYGAEGIKTFEDFYNKYGKDNSSGKKKTKALVEAAYEDYRQDVGAVNCLSDLLTCVDSVLKIAKSSKEVINAFVNCMMVARMRESLKAVIDEMYAQSTDSDMRTALSNVKNYCVSEMDALAGTMVRSVAGIGVTVLKEFVGDFWDDLANMVPIAGPIIKGVKIGAAAGEGICNMLFSTGNTRDNYYLAKSTVEFVDIARKASLSLQKKYSANKTTEAANAYIDSVRLYISVLNLDAENGRKFCETACNDGLINGVSNWINGGNAKYDEIERCTNSIQKSNKEFIDLISISWIFADNYLKTDYPEMYDTLCQNILTSPKYASTITQVKIDLSGKATVYFNVPSYAAGFKPVSGVQVQYKKNNGSYSMLADLANPCAKSASHSITLSNSDTYTYRVRTYAKLTTGKIEYSDWSEEYTTLANPAETPEIYCKVGAIGVDVRVKNNYFLSTGFNESQSGVVTTVEIYRRRQGESGKKLIGTISDVDRVNLFTDKNPGTTKCYYSARTVVRYNGKTYYSKYSQEVCTIMSGNIPKDPRLDINIRANSSSPKTRAVTYADAANGFSIELAWDKIDGISTYEVYRKLDEAKLYVYIGKTDSGNTSFVDNTVSEAGRYDYIIKFYQDIGGEKVLCGESQSASVLVERVAQQTETVEIKKGKTATISINSGNLSDGSTVSWSTSSDCITLTPSEDGTSCEVKANSKGSATVTVTITHADGSTVSDTFEIEAKSKGVFATIFDIILAPFRAIINLFKKLFGK
ncbi:MAG: lectin-like protein [Acutalibacteraceae bacterium]